MKIGFIGTGLMGFPMAKNLLDKSLDLNVFSRTIQKAKPLEKIGAKTIIKKEFYIANQEAGTSVASSLNSLFNIQHV